MHAHGVTPVVLVGRGVRLEPLTFHHIEGLQQVTLDGELWRSRLTSVPEPDRVEEYVTAALAMPDRVPFTVIDDGSATVLGCTSYAEILAQVRRLEIGYTWYAQRAQRTHVNTVCKLLLLAHAFDTLEYRTVGWRTDNLNLTSQRAIERLGAKKDGVIRGHQLRRDGTVRDTVMYSMTADEWPGSRDVLLTRLATRD
ncbi:GNAT family N-acetyltransferase [Tessaracoccus caeni]|uniref:GNAT family N-acetyltransferase n=1 Tax=Tessaracoccus caeni TaxID=3031239 RepID=UPI0023DC09BF|nr:GNAT family protein [Tessaracoccus caeni]MDF1486730.1 GNAT family protein [Tessaracoccus caeni]